MSVFNAVNLNHLLWKSSLAVEIEERTQDSSGQAEVQAGIAAAMLACAKTRGERGGRARGRSGRGGGGFNRASASQTSKQIKKTVCIFLILF